MIRTWLKQIGSSICARDPRFCRCPNMFGFGRSASNSALVSLRHATPEQCRRDQWPSSSSGFQAKHGRHMATSYRNPQEPHAHSAVHRLVYKFCKGNSINIRSWFWTWVWNLCSWKLMISDVTAVTAIYRGGPEKICARNHSESWQRKHQLRSVRWSAAVTALERTTSIASGWKAQWEHQLRTLQATDWWFWGRTR